MKRAANLILYFIISFIFGITLASFINIQWLEYFFINTAIIFCIILFFNKIKSKEFSFLLACIIVICLAVFLGMNRTQNDLYKKDNLAEFRDTRKSVLLSGIIVKEPDIRDNNTKYTVLVESFGEKILISAPIFPKFFYGDKISFEGLLETPTEFENFSYKNYLLKDGVRTVSYYPNIELLEKKSWTFYGGILKIKDKLRDSVQNILPYPKSEIISAIILGDKQLLPQEVKDVFSRVGLSHIVAISGMHIMIIAQVLKEFLEHTKLKKKGFYIVSAILLFYILLVGFPASAVRAGIMAVILLFAERIKKPYFLERALLLAAFLILIFNPLLLRYDVGFQLSFLAVLGIAKTAPIFEFYLRKITKIKLPPKNLTRENFFWTKFLHGVLKVLAVTLGAQTFTLPILIYNFGSFSLISPLANVLVVPILYLIILFGFPAIVIGTFSAILGTILAFPVLILLSYIENLSRFLAKIPLSSINISIGVFWASALYILIGIVSWKLQRKLKLVNVNL